MNGNMKKEAVARLAFLVGQGLDSAILSGYDRENLVFFSDHLDKTSAVHGEVRQCEELRQAVDGGRRYPLPIDRRLPGAHGVKRKPAEKTPSTQKADGVFLIQQEGLAVPQKP